MGLSYAIIPYSTFLRTKLFIKNKHSKHQGFGNTLKSSRREKFLSTSQNVITFPRLTILPLFQKFVTRIKKFEIQNYRFNHDLIKI